MKYAFVAMIVIYLFTYGCIQEDKEEHKSASHEVSESSMEHAAQPAEEATVDHAENAPAPEAHAEKTVIKEDKDEHSQDEAVSEPAEADKHEAPVVAHEPTEKIEKKTEQVAAVPPCAKAKIEGEKSAAAHPCVTPCPAAQPQVQASGSKPTKEELQAAMQKMVKATNDMVLMTRQLVLATQQMLEATQDGVAEEAPAAGEPQKQ